MLMDERTLALTSLMLRVVNFHHLLGCKKHSNRGRGYARRGKIVI